jgi:hypothetical protein
MRRMRGRRTATFACGFVDCVFGLGVHSVSLGERKECKGEIESKQQDMGAPC